MESNHWAEALADWTDYQLAGNRRPGTIAKRLYHLKVLARTHPDPWQVTMQQLAAFLANPGWGPATKKSWRTSLVVFYRWAIAAGRLNRSPADLLPTVLVPRRPVLVPPEQLIDDAIAAASSRDRLMLLLASRAGLRRVEIARLRWDDVADTHLVVREGKGGHSRIVPLVPQLRAELGAVRRRRLRGELEDGWRYRVDPGSRWVFPARAGGPMSPDTVGPIITRGLGAEATSRDLRRRFATRAHQGTHDLRAVQELLGHASITTTQVYVAVGGDDLVAAVLAAA